MNDLVAASGPLTRFARRIALLGVIVTGLLALGTIGLAVGEGVGPWYAFRWALDTAATVGGFPQPRTTVGQVTHVGLIVVGVGTLFYDQTDVGHLSDRRAGLWKAARRSDR